MKVFFDLIKSIKCARKREKEKNIFELDIENKIKNLNEKWNDSDFRKCKSTNKIFFEEDILHLKDEEEYIMTTPMMPVISLYKRRGNYIYNKYMNCGKVIRWEKKKIFNKK